MRERRTPVVPREHETLGEIRKNANAGPVYVPNYRKLTGVKPFVDRRKNKNKKQVITLATRA